MGNRWGLNYVKKTKCNKCDVDLIVGDNWAVSRKNNSTYTCKTCCGTKSTKYQLNNPNVMKKARKKYQTKEGIGVYQIMLDSICLYVGEGLMNQRKDKHLKYDCDSSSVVKYCLKHNINRKLLSFNVLEYEDDTIRRKQKEDWYITFLNPIINPTPPLGIYEIS